MRYFTQGAWNCVSTVPRMVICKIVPYDRLRIHAVEFVVPARILG